MDIAKLIALILCLIYTDAVQYQAKLNITENRSGAGIELEQVEL